MAVLGLSVPSEGEVTQDRAPKPCLNTEVCAFVEIVPIDTFIEALYRDFFCIQLFHDILIDHTQQDIIFSSFISGTLLNFPKHSQRSELTCMDDMALAMQEIQCEQQMD